MLQKSYLPTHKSVHKKEMGDPKLLSADKAKASIILNRMLKKFLNSIHN